MKDVCKLNQNITGKFKQVNQNTRLMLQMNIMC